ncbi:hypothetical protein QN277_009933 [Acacia crassicarpa]|uniref:non-specific serine/threonine protein kinase n=1 Tax=Acacia crassicarpa TaxID=499986 RepID=A0AAE1JN68_9FABA|nr:hypothetical protein QN277_009933 [Acacia crassicarpa]
MGENSFSGFIPKDIGNLSKLEVVSLAMNYLSGPIPSSLFNISTLKILYIGGNSLSGLLPSSLGCDFSNLEELSLTQNELTGQIPKCITNASNLIVLDFASNKFSGIIPYELGNLTNLMSVYFNGNDLNGLIPSTVNKLQELQHLSLSFNRLQGPITDKLCQIKKLSELNLAKNMFVGMIPECLWNTSLRVLDLSSNNLISQIPSSLWSLQDILTLDLSSNALSGTISPQVSNFRTIILLNLSRNQISGTIPTTMGGLQTLQNLSLSHNKLQGSIPESFSGMISIESLDLSHNQLSGVIPKSLELLVHMKQINVSCNLLYGEIPNGGPFQNFAYGSLVMDEDLCGKPQLKVHPCKKGNKHMSTKMILVIKCLLPIVFAIILVASCLMFLKFKKGHASHEMNNKDFLNVGAPIRISYYDLLQATNRFDECNFLGKGSFGSVYKGILSNGKIVAVKVFNSNLEEALRSFDIECAVICTLRHRNLTKIISSCSNGDFKSLIMEFMSNGSLDRWLYSHNHCLDVVQRLNIMIDVASALEYLHLGSSTSVVHCDIKPSNVLLDENMVAHLSDFGIAKLLSESQSEIYTTTLATIGYMAPEYGSKGAVSIKGDVYSFGILLMEMLTRKKPTDEMFVQGLTLKEFVSKSTPHSIIDILDDNLLHTSSQKARNILLPISSVFELALNCCTDAPQARPDMSEVVVSLGKHKAMLMQNIAGATC